MIIVLGEALIAIGAGTVGHDGSFDFYLGGTAALVTVLAMWWSYFDWPHKVGEHALKRVSGVEEARMARDAYTIGHYPLVAGVVLFAVGMEELLAHPADALPDPARWALIGGLILFFLSIAWSAWRWERAVAWERLVLAALLGLTGLLLDGLSGGVLAAWIAAVVVITLTVETVRHRSELEALRAETRRTTPSE